MVTVDIGGYTPEALLSVDDSQTGGNRLATATLVVGSTPTNRSNINDGDEVSITRGTDTTFTGFVKGRPSKSRDGTLEVEIMEKRLELKHIQVNRTFNNVDSGEAVKQAVKYEAVPYSSRTLFRADNISNWSGDVPILELYTEAPSDAKQPDPKPLYNHGNDMVFAGFKESQSGSFYVRNDNLGSDLIGPGAGGLLKVITRMLVNDQGSQFDVELEMTDSNGQSYVWDIPTRGSQFSEVELPAEEASPNGQLSTSLSAEYRFTISGPLNENRGVFIDAAHAVPYAASTRGTNITTNNVETTGRKITRRVDASAMEFIQDLATEDRHDFWIDASDDLHYEPSGGTFRGDRAITEGTTAVTEASFDRDAEQVTNEVIVEAANNIQVTVRNPASVEFYGVAARQEPIVDSSIQTRSEAEARGRGFLEENAWNGNVATFEIADAKYKDVSVADELPVTWPTQDVDGDFVVRSRDIDRSGIVTLSLGVSVRGQ